KKLGAVQLLAMRHHARPGWGTAHRKRPFQKLQHRAARGTMVFLRVIDDKELSTRKCRLDRNRREPITGEILLDSESRDHRNAKTGHNRALNRIRMIERHRAGGRESV